MDHSKELSRADIAAARRLGKLYPTRLDEVVAAVKSGTPECRAMEHKTATEAFRALSNTEKTAFIQQRQTEHVGRRHRQEANGTLKRDEHQAEYKHLVRRLRDVGLVPTWRHWHSAIVDRRTGEVANIPSNPPRLTRTECRLFAGKIRGAHPVFTATINASSRCQGRLNSMRAAIAGLEALSVVSKKLIELKAFDEDKGKETDTVSMKATAA